MKKTLAAAAVLFSFAAPYGRAADADEQAIRKAVLEVHTRMNSAMRELNPDKMFASILDAGPGTIIDDGVMRASRQEALEAVRRGIQAFTGVERKYDRTDVTVLAPGVALLTANGTATFVLSDGRTFSSPFALTEVFVLRGGEWKLVHGHHSIPNPQ